MTEIVGDGQRKLEIGSYDFRHKCFSQERLSTLRFGVKTYVCVDIHWTTSV